MIRNFFKTAFRNLLKHKGFSFINVMGLAIGITACLLILQYVTLEWSYDNFHKNGKNVYRLQQDRYNEGKLSTQWAAGAAGIGKLAKDNIPEIKSYSKLTKRGAVISFEDKKFREENLYFASEDFLTMFSYPVIKGNPAKALTEPNTAVITESVAKKYFGSQDPVGKVLSANKQFDLKVSAVVKDMPVNTHLKFDILVSFITFVKMTSPEAETTLNWDGFMTYVQLNDGVDPKKVEAKIANQIEKEFGKEYREANVGVVYKLQPLSDIHLYSNYMMEAEPNGNGQSVKFLLVISIFIIVIAWINYINLSTARAVERAREVGVRKVLGSYRMQLIRQFLTESMLINLLAVILAVLLVVVVLPLFSRLTGKEISFSLIATGQFWLALAGLFLVGSFLSGLYPAFVLSGFKPIAVLKGRLTKTGHGALLRQTLVIVQFAASVALMVGTYSVYKQLKFMQDQNLGINIDQTLVLRGPNVRDSTYPKKFNAFKEEMLRLPAIKEMAASSDVPGHKVNWNAGGIRLVGSDPKTTNQYRIIGIDQDFIKAFGLKLLKGRNFSKEFGNEWKSVLFNQTAVKLLGFSDPEKAIGKQIEFWGDQYTIVGIVSDHHQESLREAYDAHIFRYFPDSDGYYSMKLGGSNADVASVIQSVKSRWESFFPGNPFEYFFLDEHYAKQYQADRNFGQTFAVFSLLAIIVACLGLFGLASFVTTQRTKEIGIRKISGAGISNIMALLVKDFMKPVVISFLIAVPVTYYLLTKWLENYHFKMPITYWIFIVPVILIMIIAVATVSTQTFKAATANPVTSLRSE